MLSPAAVLRSLGTERMAASEANVKLFDDVHFYSGSDVHAGVTSALLLVKVFFEDAADICEELIYIHIVPRQTKFHVMGFEVFLQLHCEMTFAREYYHYFDWHGELTMDAGLTDPRKDAEWPAAPKGLMDDKEARFLLAFGL